MGAFSSDIAALGGRSLTITRATTATEADTHGRMKAGATTTVSVLASVQPMSGQDLQRLPEGLRTRELCKLYCDAELRTLDDGTGLVADRFELDGKTWEIQAVEHWGDFWKAIAAKVPA